MKDDNNNDELIPKEKEENPKIGKSKLQGLKNIFGFVDKDLKEKVKTSKESLNKLYKFVKAKYKELKLGKISYDDECGKKLKTALTDLKSLCDTAEKEGDVKSKGREFGKYMFHEYETYERLDNIGNNWDSFLDGTALLLTLYANCGRTSAIPYSALGDAANICEKYYVYVHSYCVAVTRIQNEDKKNQEEALIEKDAEEDAKEDLVKYDKKVNKEMREITLNKIEKNKEWEKTKKNILKKPKKIGKIVVGVLTSPIWVTWAGVKFLKKKLGLGKKEYDIIEFEKL